MVRQLITEEIWEQLQNTMRFLGCHRWGNDRNIMEVTYALINMRVKLGMVTKGQLDYLAQDSP